MVAIAPSSVPDPDESVDEQLVRRRLLEIVDRQGPFQRDPLPVTLKALIEMGDLEPPVCVRAVVAALPPPLLEDVDGYDGKPDPSSYATTEELFAGLRAFWEWAGAPSSRKLASRAAGAFSHTTASNLLAEVPWRRPPLTLEYVQALIRACGGDEEEVRRWTTAWRRVRRAGASSDRGDAVIRLHRPAN